MELRRILMGLYLLAFPAMMWGTDSGCARYCRRRAFRTPQGNSGQFRFQRRFHLFLVPCIPVQRQRSAHRRSAEQLQDRIFRLPFHADKLRPPLPATGNILQHQPVQHHLRETSARRRRIRSPAGGSLHYIVHPQYRHPRHLRIQLHQGGAVQPCRLWRTQSALYMGQEK